MDFDAKKGQKDLKKFQQFLGMLKGRVLKNSRTLKQFMKYSGLTRAEVEKSLTLEAGSFPLVVPANMKPLQQINGGFVQGQFSPSYPNQIEVDEELVWDYVYGHYKFTSAQIEMKLEATILHEMVHWARNQKKKDPGAKKGGRLVEAGKLFECMAYGGNIRLRDTHRDSFHAHKKDLGAEESYKEKGYKPFQCTEKKSAAVRKLERIKNRK